MNASILEKNIANGVINAELNELFEKFFQAKVYAGMDIRHNTTPIKITIKVLNPIEVIGENKFGSIQLQNMIAQRLNVPVNNIQVVFEKIMDRGLEPAFHCEELRLAFLDNKSYKRTVNSIIKNARASGAQGVMIRVAGKIKGQRARAVKYSDGYFIQSGHSAKEYLRFAKSQAKLKQGTIGIQVCIMLPYDVEGVRGPCSVISDRITILEPKVFN
ncbi:uncharacterized protein LOC143921982 [Arctopsyche grandis]|uniref:uncharacterized protein LOC143921982 n=1 Tax=Arctopsyche grandis TaxID=121162 RepID=UPI00406D639B